MRSFQQAEKKFVDEVFRRCHAAGLARNMLDQRRAQANEKSLDLLRMDTADSSD
jgi:hypothetical protein